jgi:hypothetical protein
MSKNIKAEELESTLKQYLNEYQEEIGEDVKETTDNITKEAVKEIKKTSPRRKGTRKNPYYKGWTKQTGKQNKGKYTVKIHNKTNYQLTHLLEFGHATRNGKRTKAIPHIRPLEEKYNKIYEEKLTTVIKRRSK